MDEDELVSFRLKLTPQMKAAAVAMAATWYYEWGPDGRTVRGFYAPTINATLTYLLKSGMRAAYRDIDVDLEAASALYRAWRAIDLHFATDPAAMRAKRDDFGQVSPAYGLLTALAGRREECEPGSVADWHGVSREEAVEEVETARLIFARRANAKAALGKALGLPEVVTAAADSTNDGPRQESP